MKSLFCTLLAVSTWTVIAVRTSAQCSQPYAVTASATGTTTGHIVWLTQFDVQQLEYVVDQSASLPTVTGNFLPSTTYFTDPTGLTPATLYYAHIRSHCSNGDTSPWVVDTFVTQSGGGGCATPTVVSDIEGDTYLDFSWTPITGATSYDYEVDNSTAAPTAFTNTTNTTATVSGLTPSTLYVIHVRANCASGASSWQNLSVVTGVSIDCDKPHAFWSVESDGIHEFQILSNSYFDNGLVAPLNFSLGGLAYASNPLSPVMPTFFAPTVNFDSLAYYDGLAWQTLGLPAGLKIANGAGFNQNLYFYKVDPITWSFTDKIVRHDGSAFDTAFYTLPVDQMFASSDLACDDSGRVYFLTGDSVLDADWINVVDSNGILVQQYAVSIDAVAMYGMYVDGDTMYLAFGPAVIYPNSLLPVSLSGSTATVGAPLSFPFGGNDLATCEIATFVTTVGKPLVSDRKLLVYPNPTNQLVHLSLPAGGDLRIQNILGRLMENRNTADFNLTLDVSGYPRGMYSVSLMTLGGIFQSQFIVR